MPAMPNVPQVLKFVLNWVVEGDTQAKTVHYYRYTGGPPSAANAATMASNCVFSAATGFAAVCLATTGASVAECTDLTSPTAAQGVGGTPWAGSDTGTRLPPGSAFLVNHSMSRRYRGGKPRTYLPVGKAEDVLASGLWSGASQSAVDSAWGTFNASMLSSGVGCTITELVNVSFFHGSTVVINPITGRARNVPTMRATPLIDTITGHTTSPKVASQRRRNRDA